MKVNLFHTQTKKSQRAELQIGAGIICGALLSAIYVCLDYLLWHRLGSTATVQSRSPEVIPIVVFGAFAIAGVNSKAKFIILISFCILAFVSLFIYTFII